MFTLVEYQHIRSIPGGPGIRELSIKQRWFLTLILYLTRI